MSFRYQPYYCEENVWWLCQAPELVRYRRRVVFISNAAQRCALWQQRAAVTGAPVLWDYHVVLLLEDGAWQIWDLDSRLASPARLEVYLAETFHSLGADEAQWAPQFRVLEASAWLAQFTTDRSHMRTADGSWLQPPPPWSPPTAPGYAMNLSCFIDMSAEDTPGEVFELEQMKQQWLSPRKG